VAEGAYIAYYRVSTDRQGRSGLGLEAQRAAVADHLNGGHWKLVGEFTECESGKRDDRPALALALAACRRHKATLIVAKLDRLSRNLSLIVRLRESKVAFCAADNPHATAFTVNILASVAEWEREQISKRTSDALQAAKARGKQLGLRSPKRADAKQVSALGVAAFRKNADHRAGNLIPVIQAIQASGATTFRAIAEAMNARGVRTARGGEWHSTSIRNALMRQKTT
jgi:DNA invertase Pin-like site-specific DNA recombinase